MNLIELMFFASFIVVGYLCGKWFGQYFGIVGWITGFIFGLIAVAIGYGILSLLLKQLHKWRPFRPLCENGKCCNDDYKFVEFSKDGVVLSCQCGNRYFQKNRSFMKILDDGSTKPYMKRKGFLGRWVKDA